MHSLRGCCVGAATEILLGVSYLSFNIALTKPLFLDELKSLGLGDESGVWS